MSNKVRDEHGWLVEANSYSNCATRQRRHQDVELALDDTDLGLEVTIDEGSGSGYMDQTCRTVIPMHVLIALLENKGYSVALKPRNDL